MKRAARADTLTYPKTFRARRLAANGTKLYVRVGGRGPAGVLLHGYGETGDIWVPLAKDLARDHTVVVPGLRGMGLSAKPAGGYDKKTQASDAAGILDALKIERAVLVTHDIGNMVGYAFAAQYRNRVICFVVIDTPLPGVGPWEEILKDALLWHFRFWMRFAASDVEEGVVPDTGHWIMGESPKATIELVRAFLDRVSPAGMRGAAG